MQTSKIIRFSTAVNTNGNTFQVEVDIASNTVKRGYGLFWASSDDIKLTRKELTKLVNSYVWLGYKEL